MSVIFKPENHKYESMDPNENIDWISVTSFVSMFKKKFDAVAQSEKSSKNPKSKWYKIPPDKIREIWAKEGDRAVEMGSWYHDEREADLTSVGTIMRQGINVPIIKPIVEGGFKVAPVQRLTEGIYPEHFVYLKSAGLCGQSDRVEVVRDTVDIVDYKTNKEIRKEGFKNWEGITDKMLGPCSHLDDCNLNHYALQLSIYMYIILKHNPRYKPGKLTLHHVIFEKDGDDEYGYPILRKDFVTQKPIVKEIVPYEVPYLKNEVRAMLAYLEENRKKK